MTAGLVSFKTEDGVTRLLLDRPRALNALDEAMAEAFTEALERVAREPSKVVVITGNGAFSAGGDLSFIRDSTKVPRADLPARMKRFYGSFLAVRNLPQATIAQIGGPAVGAGLCLALACDLRTVLYSARLALNFVRLGLNPGMGAWPLARAVLGEPRARELLFTGRFFTGRDLMAWGGAAAGAVSPIGLQARTRDLAREIAAQSGSALRLLKAETRLGSELDGFLRHEAEGQADCFKGPELLEGLAALKEGRKPRY